MRIIISPAKQMGEERDFLTPAGRPIYEERAGELAAHLRSLPYGEMKKLLACSDALAQAAYEAYRAMDFSRADTPAILAYRGIQYQYMAPQVFEKAYFAYIQEHLRILSGLYGILRPLDAVVPYRLEMQAKVRFGPWRDLYHFWGDSLCRALTEEGDAWITCTFGELLGEKLVEKGVYVKMARGEMVRWMAEHSVERPEDLRYFDRLGFSFCPERSDGKHLVFLMDGETRRRVR